MSIRTILAAVSGGSASAGVIDSAFRLAARFGGHVEVLHVRADPRQIAITTAADFTPAVLTEEMVDTIERDAADLAGQARALFDGALSTHHIVETDTPAKHPHATAAWRDIVGEGSSEILLRARLFDVLVLGRSGRVVDEAHTDAIESALLSSGRPVYVATATPATTVAEKVTVAWNDTPEATRALSAAMPILEKAQSVHLVSIGDSSVVAMVEHLAWHGIKADAKVIDAASKEGAAAQLLAATHELGSDLLVMGGYGRAPWRESLFGGVTTDVLSSSLLPLFLSH